MSIKEYNIVHPTDSKVKCDKNKNFISKSSKVNNKVPFPCISRIIYLFRLIAFSIQNTQSAKQLPSLLYTDPRLPKTTPTVFIKILISNRRFHSAIYLLSSLTTSSKSVISLRPLTCHMPVSPGLTASLTL